jgi:hypothetical protein
LSEENKSDAVFYSDESIAALKSADSSSAVDLNSVRGISGYAELFESFDGNEIPYGYFVTLDGNKIRKANSKDRYVLGVTAAAPAVLGANSDVYWKGKYITDKWGKIQYDEIVVPAILDEAGEVVIKEHKEFQPIINPKWDKDRKYIPRILRPEWVNVILLGQSIVRDDGTCQVNGNCIPNDEGLATSSPRGYRVMARRTENQVLILIRANTINLGK